MSTPRAYAKAVEHQDRLRELLRSALVERGYDPDQPPPVDTSAARVALGNGTNVELIEALLELDRGRAWSAVWKIHIALCVSRAHPELRAICRAIVPK